MQISRFLIDRVWVTHALCMQYRGFQALNELTMQISKGATDGKAFEILQLLRKTPLFFCSFCHGSVPSY